MKKQKKFIILLALTVVFTFAACSSNTTEETGTTGGTGGTYPERDIKYIIQSNPGGGSDLFARTFTTAVTNNKLLDVTITPENMPGASGAVAFAYVAEKAEDPYFLLNGSGQIVTTPILGQGTEAAEVNYESFTPIAALAMDEMVIAVEADSKYQTLDDLIQATIDDPESVIAGGTGMGAPDSICYHLLEKESGGKFNFVVFDGGDEVNSALLGKSIDVGIGNPGDFIELYKGGRLRLLGTFSEERLEALPDIPTCKEQGYDVIYQLTRGILAPKDIPAEAVEVLETVVAEYMETSEWKEYYQSNSLTQKYMNSEEYTQFLKDSTETHTVLLKEMGVIE